MQSLRPETERDKLASRPADDRRAEWERPQVCRLQAGSAEFGGISALDARTIS
jgi:hypothetical protein